MANGSPRGGVNMNGAVALADTVGGAAGTLLGTERVKIQRTATAALDGLMAPADKAKLDAHLSTYGVVVNSASGNLAVANTWYDLAASGSLPAGTYLVWGAVSMYPNASNSVLQARIVVNGGSPVGLASVNGTPPNTEQLVVVPQVVVAGVPVVFILQGLSRDSSGTSIAGQAYVGYLRIA